jgi:hypothetical protein
LRHEPVAERHLSLAEVVENCRNVEVEFRRALFASAMNLFDNGILSHGFILALGVPLLIAFGRQ